MKTPYKIHPLPFHLSEMQEEMEEFLLRREAFDGQPDERGPRVSDPADARGYHYEQETLRERAEHSHEFCSAYIPEDEDEDARAAREARDELAILARMAEINREEEQARIKAEDTMYWELRFYCLRQMPLAESKPLRDICRVRSDVRQLRRLMLAYEEACFRYRISTPRDDRTQEDRISMRSAMMADWISQEAADMARWGKEIPSYEDLKEILYQVDVAQSILDSHIQEAD